MKMKFFIIIPALIIALDQITKFFAARNLQSMGTIPLIQDVFHLTYVGNHGAAFGIFGGARWWLVGISIAIIIGIIYIIATRKLTCKWQKLGIAFMLGGAVGNLIDRIFIGYVIDFLDFRLINFPVFNVADIFITVGAVIVIICTILSAKTEKSEPNES